MARGERAPGAHDLRDARRPGRARILRPGRAPILCPGRARILCPGRARILCPGRARIPCPRPARIPGPGRARILRLGRALINEADAGLPLGHRRSVAGHDYSCKCIYCVCNYCLRMHIVLTMDSAPTLTEADRRWSPRLWGLLVVLCG